MMRTRRRWALLAATSIAAALLAGVSPAHSATAAQPFAKPPVPSNGAYIGAYVYTDPNASHSSRDSASGATTQQVDTNAFQKQIGRGLAIDNHFQEWGDAGIGPDQLADARAGSIPMLSWACYTGGADAVIDGSQDANIDRVAKSVKAYGHPVFIRYWWEMNLFGSRNQACLGGDGPTGYVRAWQHVVDRFRQDGATNASFVWVIANLYDGGGADQFYPGDSYVDWVGIDGYARVSPVQPFAQIFQPFYSQWSKRKPIMIAETGVIGTPAVQASWLTGMFNSLSAPGGLSDIKAVCYFDALTGHDYRLTGPAITAFRAGAARPYFAPTSPHFPLHVAVHNVQVSYGQVLNAPVASSGFPVPSLSLGPGALPGLSLFDHGDGTATIQGVARYPGRVTVDVVATSPGGRLAQPFTVTELGSPQFLTTGSVYVQATVPFSYPVQSAAYPPPTMSVTGLPGNVRFVEQSPGQGYLTGTPEANHGGVYDAVVTATNSLGTTKQALTVTVLDTPKVVSPDAFAAYRGVPFSTTIGTGGFPEPALSVSGLRPAWLIIRPNQNGSLTLSGVPTRADVFSFVVHAVGGSRSIDYDIIVTVH